MTAIKLSYHALWADIFGCHSVRGPGRSGSPGPLAFYGIPRKENHDRSISGISPALTDEDAYDIGKDLASLQSHTLGSVKRINAYTLIEA